MELPVDYSGILNKDVLATGRERQLTTGKRAERTKHDVRCSIIRSAIGQASCLILHAPSSTDVPVLLLNQPSIYVVSGCFRVPDGFW